jgi:hypothetical protein
MSFNTNWVYIPKNNIQLFVNIISYDDVLNYTNDEWDNKLAEIKVTIAKLKAEDEVKAENLVEKVAFASDKENLILNIDGDATVFEIKRLTNKELWLDDDVTAADGEIWKLEAK